MGKLNYFLVQTNLIIKENSKKKKKKRKSQEISLIFLYKNYIRTTSDTRKSFYSVCILTSLSIHKKMLSSLYK